MIGWRFWNWTTAAWNWAANWRYAAPTSSSWRRASSGWRSWTCRWMKRRPKSVEARLEADARPNRWGIKPRWLSSSRWCSRAPNWGRSSSTTGSSAGVNRIKFSRYPSIHPSIDPSIHRPALEKEMDGWALVHLPWIHFVMRSALNPAGRNPSVHPSNSLNFA